MTDLEEQLDKALAALRERKIDPGSAGGAVALEFLLGTPSPASAALSPAPPASTPATPTSGAGAAEDDEPVETLAAWTEVNALRLADFFDFSEDRVHLTVPSGRLPRSKADRQRIITLLMLAADRKALGTERTHADPIIATLHDYAAFDQNMGGNLNKISNEITRSGRPKDYVYKITQPGLEHAKQLIRQLVTNEEALEA
jgi:hypothetical protein